MQAKSQQACRLALAMATTLLSAALCRADDWPQWLGPERDAVWRESGVLQRFPEGGPTLRWKAEIGSGFSGPAVTDGRVFVMDRIADSFDPRTAKFLHDGKPPENTNYVRQLLPGKERVVCLREADGNPLWVHEYDCPYTTATTYATGPRVTPCVDDGHVYTLGAEGNLFCLRVEDGTVVWSKDFKKDYGLQIPVWGVASHPLVDGEKLLCVVVGDGTTCVAFDKRTGKEIWKSLSAAEPGYCPPMIYKIGDWRQLIIWHSEAVNGLDPETGEIYWSVPFKASNTMAIGAPRLEGDSLFLMCLNRQSAMIRLVPDGRSASIVWQGNSKRGIGGVLNTAFLRDGHIYACGHAGKYICARLDTGEHVWSTFQPSTGKRPASWANVFTEYQVHTLLLCWESVRSPRAVLSVRPVPVHSMDESQHGCVGSEARLEFIEDRLNRKPPVRIRFSGFGVHSLHLPND